MKLTLFIENHRVRVTVHSKTLRNAGFTVARREFEQIVRKPRLFDYVESVYINQKSNKYVVVEDGVKTVYSSVADSSIVSELVTYKRDFEDRSKLWMRGRGISYVAKGETVVPSSETPAPTCMWLMPRIRVVLGLDDRIQPPELIGNMHGCPVVDRTGVVNFGTNKIKTDHPMPDFNVKEDRRLGSLMLERAEDLWQWIENEGRLGIIWWSGGIDSTALLVAMIKTSTPDRMRLVKVGMNQRSIEEYPSFFEKYIKKMPYMFVSHNDGMQIDLSALHITGEIGDQIFGSDYLRACFGGGGRDFPGKEHFVGNINSPWQDVISLFVRDQLIEKRLPTDYQSKIMDTYELLNTKAPLDIKTLFDFWWWSNFNLKYTHVSNRLQVNSPDAAVASKRVKAFFDSDTFQRWSVCNHDKKIGETWKSYKTPLKRFVYKFNKDKDWFENKTKVQSLRMGANPQFLLMDSKYQRFGIADRKKIIETYFGGDDGRS